MSAEFRLYLPEECTGQKGYPPEWHAELKHRVREEAGHRCIRCKHPYAKGAGEWSPCDSECLHGVPFRARYGKDDWVEVTDPAISAAEELCSADAVEAHYRILTVHHLDGVKGNCRWWNLVALCQRCHLQIQGKVKMDRRWPHPHTAWFRPYVAAYYAFTYLGEDLSREETLSRIDELLALEVRQLTLDPSGNSATIAEDRYLPEEDHVGS